MNNKYLNEIRSMRTKATENSAKAREFVQNKEKEIEELKERMAKSCSVLDTDAYINLMKQAADKETELSALRDIADRAAGMNGYTDADVMAAFGKYCAEYNPMISKKIKAFNEKTKELEVLYNEMAALQKDAILIRQEFKDYLTSDASKCRMEKLTIIPGWGHHLAELFYGSNRDSSWIEKDRAMGEYCWNAEARYNQ